MWYRLYLAKMPKKEYEEMLNMTFDEFFEKHWDKSRHESSWEKSLDGIYEFTEIIHELWKYLDYSEWMKQVEFKDDKINEYYSERSFHELDKDIIKLIIEEYSKNVAKFYKWLITWEEERRMFWMRFVKWKLKRREHNKKIFKHLYQRYYDFAWIRFSKKTKKWYKFAMWKKPYNIEKWPITNSREYEYAIFELIRIYREFDEEKDVLLYYWY